MLIPLICKQYGGKLEVEDTKVSISGESFIVLFGQQFECPHCKTKYVSDDANKHVHAGDGGVAIGNLSFGGEVKGNIVIGNAPSNTNKPVKKWWEFWK